MKLMLYRIYQIVGKISNVNFYSLIAKPLELPFGKTRPLFPQTCYRLKCLFCKINA